MDVILETKGLAKSYFNKRALRGVDLSLEKGKVLGLLGPNGSGKTTFIKIAAGVLRQSSGEVLIDGNKPGVTTKAVISYLPDRNYLYKWMKIKDAVEFFRDFYMDFDEAKCDELLKFMDLNKDLKITALSKGMMEKLNLTLVLSRKAKLYILDEPLAGVDPVAREKILDAIIQSYNEESSMLITTHLVKDIERVFDDVAFIRDGEVVLSGNAEDLRLEKGKSIDELFREVFE
ncbi:ATP-binding cassette domain-containing protein [Clostridium bovifaecis]|uniref:ATP-binding cassette domain-containing protein n=1 Tax=Clostridium bovifaecis TaxID=2184719 RepID=A0A6I6EXV3_9CLOT|nr:ATP-binding cassette domain-containing protein [Clostridium bovifaecis]